jgi:hypothetical protein
MVLKSILTIPLLLVTGCSAAPPATSADAICRGTAAARDNLAAALLADAGDRSLVAGDTLIALLDAGCGV